MSFTYDNFKEIIKLDNRTKDYEAQLLRDRNCNLVGPRQDGKTTAAAAYLLYKAITTPNICIGIASPTDLQSREVLYKIKKLIKDYCILDIDDLLVINNKASIEFFNGARIITSTVNENAFRGWSLNIVYIDEINFINSKKLEEFMDINLPVINSTDGIIITSSYRGW